MLLGFWVNYRGELNFTTVKGECDGSCYRDLGERHPECVYMYVEIFLRVALSVMSVVHKIY